MTQAPHQAPDPTPPPAWPTPQPWAGGPPGANGPAAPAPSLDVHALLDASQPRPPLPRMGLFLGGFLLVALLSALLSGQSRQMQQVMQVASALLLLGLTGGLMLWTTLTVRRFRAEQQAVEAAGELVQMRRWPEAGALLEQYLSRPARTSNLRTQALIYLSSVLARYHRYEDAIAIHDHLLEHDLVDAGSAYGLRLGRAMALLNEEHLYDADRAISELRRLAPTGRDSGGLALVELYRDVKTGHPEDAIERFQKNLPALRDQLGHRVADAYALAARAYDLLGRTVEAQDAFARATLLAPPPELFRRYPEVQKLQGRYQPTLAPPEAA